MFVVFLLSKSLGNHLELKTHLLYGSKHQICVKIAILGQKPRVSSYFPSGSVLPADVRRSCDPVYGSCDPDLQSCDSYLNSCELVVSSCEPNILIRVTSYPKSYDPGSESYDPNTKSCDRDPKSYGSASFVYHSSHKNPLRFAYVVRTIRY